LELGEYLLLTKNFHPQTPPKGHAAISPTHPTPKVLLE
jgi:hypothetical protein